jgi:hypothetical protein
MAKSAKHNYLKYSGIAFQMFFMLLIGLLLGQWLDKKFEFGQPYMTALCTILFLVGFFIKLIRDLAADKT